MNDVEKWNRYYSGEDAPPWESRAAYHGLTSFLQAARIVDDNEEDKENGESGGEEIIQGSIVCPRLPAGASVCEFGAGASATAIALVNAGFQTTAVDISPLAKKRFLRVYKGTCDEEASREVNYVVADLLGKHC
jgi:hypothetical protein